MKLVILIGAVFLASCHSAQHALNKNIEKEITFSLNKHGEKQKMIERFFDENGRIIKIINHSFGESVITYFYDEHGLISMENYERGSVKDTKKYFRKTNQVNVIELNNSNDTISNVISYFDSNDNKYLELDFYYEKEIYYYYDSNSNLNLIQVKINDSIISEEIINYDKEERIVSRKYILKNTVDD